MSQIAVWRGSKLGVFGYWHHGILCPDGSVIHYTTGSHKRNKVKPRAKRRARIVRTAFKHFKKDADHVYDVRPRDPDALLPVEQVVRRAESRLGEAGYSLLFNNCESFARWCVTGEEKSRQINSHTKYLVRGLSLGIPGALIGICLSAVKMSVGDVKKGRMIRWT